MDAKLKALLFGKPIEWAAILIMTIGCTIPTVAVIAAIREYNYFSEVAVPLRNVGTVYLGIFIILLYIARYTSFYPRTKAQP